MAILFSQSTPQGVTVNYNVVTGMSYTPDPSGQTQGNTFVQLSSWLTQASYANGDQPFPGQGFTLPGQLDVPGAETIIIARPEWSGATIVS